MKTLERRLDAVEAKMLEGQKPSLSQQLQEARERVKRGETIPASDPGDARLGRRIKAARERVLAMRQGADKKGEV